MQFIRISFFVLMIFILGCTSPSGNAQEESHEFTNKLIHESSPYLLMHAHNPVDWQPWGEAALKEAKEKNKMLIISIGYAACHWCHVMEHESFEDTAVAKIMNDNFVCIKVDREERPDVDDVYMAACQLASRRGCGWPLNSFTLPDGRPVWAGTYFPKKDWVNVLQHFIKLRQEEPEKLENYAAKLTQGIQTNETMPIVAGEKVFAKSDLDKIASNFLKNIDFKKGGREGSPKFPMPNNYEFLLKYHHLTGNQKALDAVKVTLDNMARGGIYDQLGGGFARYSTDGEWIVPHFEKMLYDNGQLVSLFSEAWKLTQNAAYKKVVEETLEFIEREMTSSEGGFYSSLDADSDGEEGKFYVWTKAQIETILGDPKTAEIFDAYYEIKEKGNWEGGKNILYRRKSASQIAKQYKLPEEELSNLISKAKDKLFKERSTRVRPGLDNKILTSWNALMLKGYVDAYQAFGKKEYLDAALKNGNFILHKILHDGNRLNRNYKDGKSVINGFLDDYALTATAFIALYEVTFDEQWLYKANDLAAYVMAHFSDETSQMFHYTSDLDPPLIARKMEVSDNVIPGSNSSMARALYSLGLYFYKPEYIEKAKQMMLNLSTTIIDSPQPNFFSNWCSLFLDLVKPPYEVAIVGNDFEAKRNTLMQHYLPDAILLGGKNEGSLELLKDKLQEGKTMIYVCQNKVCKFPVTEVEKALKLME